MESDKEGSLHFFDHTSSDTSFYPAYVRYLAIKGLLMAGHSNGLQVM